MTDEADEAGHWLDYVSVGAGVDAIALFGLYLYWYAYTDPYANNGSTEMFLVILVLGLVAFWSRKEAKKHYPKP